MRETLFYIPTQIFGIPFLGNGLVFWGLILAGIFWLIWAFIKRGIKSDDISFVFVMLIVGLLVRFFLPQIAKPEGLPIRGYGMMLTLAIIMASSLLIYRAYKKWRIPTDTIISLILWLVISGLIGARLFHVIEYWRTYADSPNPLYAVLMFSEGGLVVYGSIIGGMLGGICFFIKNKLSILAMFDLMAPAVLLGIAIGRLGCLLNGCCFGAVCEPAYGIVFPPGSPTHWSQIENNQVFISGLKFVSQKEYESKHNKTTINLIQQPATHDQAPTTDGQIENTNDFSVTKKITTNDATHFGGCACVGCRKREPGTIGSKIDTSPAVITEVEPGSSAEKAGFQPSMIVRRILFVEDLTPKEIVSPKGGPDVFSLQRELFSFAPKQWVGLSVNVPGDEIEKVLQFQMTEPEVLPVYPTQLMSFVGALILSLLLVLVERFGNRDGFTFVIFLYMYSIARFIIEMFRADEASFMGTGFSISQNISIVIFVFAIIMTIFIFRRPPQHALANRYPQAKSETTNP